IFAYLNYGVPVSRKEVINILLNGLHRLEYRGYDSAGLALDLGTECANCNGHVNGHGKIPGNPVALVRCKGKVASLVEAVRSTLTDPYLSEERIDTHVGIAHTRWATHGEPNERNAHPQTSGDDNAFVVVHNGIITNHKDLKAFLIRRGFTFSSDTDTEVIPKLMQHFYDLHKEAAHRYSFLEVVELVVMQLEGSFALACKSRYYPGECVVARRGSPLLVGIKSPHELTMNHIPIYFRQNTKGYNVCKPFASGDVAPHVDGTIGLTSSHHLHGNAPRREIEFFFASDAR
ncbi:hypothetical protein P879_10959, partial [Paragonimus westermani]